MTEQVLTYDSKKMGWPEDSREIAEKQPYSLTCPSSTCASALISPKMAVADVVA